MFESWSGLPRVHVYLVHRDPAYKKKIKDLEHLRKNSLSSSDPLFPMALTRWISEPGTHLFFNEEDWECVLIIRIR